jgi:hypothetical protein
MLSALAAGVLCVAAAAGATAPPSPPIPSNAQCHPLPALPAHRFPIRAGERLDYDIDFLGGVKVGTVTILVEPPVAEDGGVVLPISVHALSNEFFSKFGRVDSTAKSYLRPRDLRPVRYHEDFVDAERHYSTDVLFPVSGPHVVKTHFVNPTASGDRVFPFANDALDVLSTFFVLRSLDLRVGESLCFDVYGTRTLWRVWGKIEGREALSTAAGNFKTFRMNGIAARLNAPKIRRQIYLWISDDAQRLPIAAVGELDVGPMRALLSGVGTAAAPSKASSGQRPKPAAASGWTE